MLHNTALIGSLLASIALFTTPGCGDKLERDSERSELKIQKSAEAVASAMEAEEAWVAKEFSLGKKKWRDSGVYVDGEVVGMVRYSELPRDIEPVLVDEIESLDFKPGDKGPRERVIKVRRYVLADYLRLLKVDVDRIKEIHFYGGGGFAAVVKGSEFRRVQKRAYFSFGRLTSGKPLLHLPTDLVLNTTFDQVRGIAIYIDNKPPVLDDDGELWLGGEIVLNIPYYGDPLRGGVRFYQDGRMATVFKRNKAKDVDSIAMGDDDHKIVPLFAFLELRGVAIENIKSAEVVYQDEEKAQLPVAELAKMSFVATKRARGHVLLGPDKIPMQTLKLHSK